MEVELLNEQVIREGMGISEQGGRVCYDSVRDPNDKVSDSFIRRIIKSGHESVIEHGSATFRISGISRTCSHQLVRHRLASYSQRSQRYVSEDGFNYVTPESIMSIGRLWVEYIGFMKHVNDLYNRMIEAGVPKEDARYVLPNACHTKLVMTMNFREIRHFLKLRLARNAQWEIRELAHRILEIMRRVAPVIVEDIDG